jgi:N utilization substance protein B
MKSRTKARGIALQALYEFDMTGHPIHLILDYHFLQNDIEPKLQEFVRNIVSGITPSIKQIDQIIAVHAPEWPLDQVATIDRNIIRIALWEFAISKCSPVKVAINEAVELAKMYGSESTPRFINGVLGSLVSKYEDYRTYLDELNPINRGET